jgi:hypothetical protein
MIGYFKNFGDSKDIVPRFMWWKATSMFSSETSNPLAAYKVARGSKKMRVAPRIRVKVAMMITLKNLKIVQIND